jgi:hypothetical protein
MGSVMFILLIQQLAGDTAHAGLLSLAGDELLPAVDVVSRACQGRVGV